MRLEYATLLLSSCLFAASAAAAPKPPAPISVDRSTGPLIDAAAAEQIWKDHASPRLMRLYPKRHYRFVSEIAGGFNEGRTCVVTARAMLLPVQGAKLLYTPVKSATAFDAAPNLTLDQCRGLARDKLKEAVEAIAASSVAS